MKRKIEQFIAQRVDRRYIWRQEFYVFCTFSLVITSAVVVLLMDRLQLVEDLNQHISQRNTTALVLELTNDSAMASISTNSICQWLDLDVPNEEAIRAVECRYDSAQVIYDRLLQLGWKFESLEAFQRQHLPIDWRTRIEGYNERQTQIRHVLSAHTNAVAAVVMQQEAASVLRVRWMRLCLLILLIVLFPLRWIIVYFILKKALRTQPLVKKSMVIGIGSAPRNRPTRGKF